MVTVNVAEFLRVAFLALIRQIILMLYDSIRWDLFFLNFRRSNVLGPIEESHHEIIVIFFRRG